MFRFCLFLFVTAIYIRFLKIPKNAYCWKYLSDCHATLFIVGVDNCVFCYQGFFVPFDVYLNCFIFCFPDAGKRDHLNMFAKNQPPKKRRKSRTAFTNQQIYELEKRFLYQKYLTPADRDEIAQSLGLSNAQVITWFQNRRAKLKRDLEELKNDVVHTSSSSDTLVTPLISDLDQELADVKSKNDLDPRSVESNSQTEITTEGST